INNTECLEIFDTEKEASEFKHVMSEMTDNIDIIKLKPGKIGENDHILFSELKILLKNFNSIFNKEDQNKDYSKGIEYMNAVIEFFEKHETMLTKYSYIE